MRALRRGRDPATLNRADAVHGRAHPRLRLSGLPIRKPAPVVPSGHPSCGEGDPKAITQEAPREGEDIVRVLIGCERFGVLRDAFSRRGHDAWSCDLVAATGRHIQGDVLSVLDDGWDLAIFHPDCTYLAASGLHWNKRRPERERETEKALEFVKRLMGCGIERWAIENPIGCISTRIRKPDQIIQPWQFGEDASKATCLWLHNLPPLKPTNVLPGGRTARRANQTPSGQNKLGPSAERAMLRARTYQGIADAMAEQWGPGGDPT